MRHAWINFPSKTRRRCTRCGMIKEMSRDGNYGTKYYLHGKVYDKAPPCRDSNKDNK